MVKERKGRKLKSLDSEHLRVELKLYFSFGALMIITALIPHSLENEELIKFRWLTAVVPIESIL